MTRLSACSTIVEYILPLNSLATSKNSPLAIIRHKRRVVAIWTVIILFILVVPIGILVAAILLDLPPQTLYWIIPSWGIATTAAIAAAWAEIRWRRRWRTAGALLCPGCLYPFPDDEKEVCCPECGFQFGNKSVRRTWAAEKRRMETKKAMSIALIGDGFRHYPAAVSRHRITLVRYDLWSRGSMLLALVVLGAIWITIFDATMDTATNVFTIPMAIVIVLVIFVSRIRARTEHCWQNRIQNTSSVLCPECLADLGDTEAAGVCSACGHEYQREELDRLWDEERARKDW